MRANLWQFSHFSNSSLFELVVVKTRCRDFKQVLNRFIRQLTIFQQKSSHDRPYQKDQTSVSQAIFTSQITFQLFRRRFVILTSFRFLKHTSIQFEFTLSISQLNTVNKWCWLLPDEPISTFSFALNRNFLSNHFYVIHENLGKVSM